MVLTEIDKVLYSRRTAMPLSMSVSARLCRPRPARTGDWLQSPEICPKFSVSDTPSVARTRCNNVPPNLLTGWRNCRAKLRQKSTQQSSIFDAFGVLDRSLCSRLRGALLLSTTPHCTERRRALLRGAPALVLSDPNCRVAAFGNGNYLLKAMKCVNRNAGDTMGRIRGGKATSNLSKQDCLILPAP